MKPTLKSASFVGRIKWLVLILFGAYIGTYIILSALGHYEPGSGLANVIETWQPKGVMIYGLSGAYNESGHRIYFEGNTAGYFFMPLVAFDRAFVHRIRQLESKE
jgi:hypothetical protein